MDVGTQLRSAREALGLSLALVAQKTRVQPRIIAAIEHNDLSAIPPKPFGRGFIRAYAREVGLDPERTVHDYFGQFALPVQAPAKVEPRTQAWPRRETGMLAAASAVVLVLIVLALLRQGSVPVDADSDEASAVSAPAPVAAAAPATIEPRAGVGTTGTPTAAPVTVKLIADRDCWVTATTDGERALFELVRAGTEHTLRADREIAIRAGDAGALRVGVNGRAPQRFGGDGAVRNARITPDGDGSAPR